MEHPQALASRFSGCLIAAAMLAACSSPGGRSSGMHDPVYEEGSFGYDQNFLAAYDTPVVLRKNGARVLVSPKYQGKVFTSSAAGDSGLSFGWINYAAFDKPRDPHMNAYGGENRLWLGPEGNRFSLFFPPGLPMTFENWKTPPGVDTEPWQVVAVSPTEALLRKEMSATNYAGADFRMLLTRRIATEENVGEVLGVTPDQHVRFVGYRTDNIITNTGEESWTRLTGAPCIWILDMFTPSPRTTIIIPYRGKRDAVTSDYFGEVPPDRLAFGEGFILFKADGRSRGKVGINSRSALPLAASIDADKNVLTIVKFDLDTSATYLNQEWNTRSDPFVGDAVNAYNDGPLADGSQMGPFYEIESVSPAAFLDPGESLRHAHTVFHFTGPAESLAAILAGLLAVPAAEMERVFGRD